MKGELKTFVNESRELLLESLAYSEVMIDYAEEDIPEDIIESIVKKLDALTDQIQKIVDASHRRKGLIEGFKVAIVGKPNVGKSSLLNALLSYDRAIVSEIAGTTRDTIEEQIRIGTHIIRIVDTAGIRNASDDIEKRGIERSMSSIEDADIVVVLFDGSRPFDEEDEKVLSIIKETEEKAFIVAVNKTDLERKLDRGLLGNNDLIEVSAKKGFDLLTKKIESLLDSVGKDEEMMLVTARQIEAVTLTKQSILDAKEPLLSGELEFFSYHLKEAVKQISSISKPYDNEEILDKMFSEFCLGK